MTASTNRDLQAAMAFELIDLRTAADAKRLAENLPDFPLTDAGNADAFVALHGDDIRYDCTGRRRLVWDETRWAPDDDGEWVRRAIGTARALLMRSSSALETDEKRRTDIARHALRSEAGPRLRFMQELAESHAHVAVLGSDLDADPWLLNVANGVLNLRTTALDDHNRKLLLTKLAPVAFIPEAPAPRWTQFLTEFTGGNAAIAGYLARVAGYTLTGMTSEQQWFLFWGPGGNGKSVFLEVLRGLLGDYSRQTGFATFLAKGHETIREDIVRLAGARLVTALEPPDGQRFNESLLKLLTGSDTVTARQQYRASQEFAPTFKLLLAGNHKPQVWDTGAGFWRRVKLIECRYTVPPERRIKDLHKVLLAEEGPGILWWAVQGCLDWQQQGLGEPPEVEAATAAYRDDEDVLGEFVETTVTRAPTKKLSQPDLRHAYERYCEAAGIPPLGTRTFVARLRERGFEQLKSNGKRWWMNVEFRVETPEPPTPTGTKSTDEPPF